jgi:hypothetical protein
MTVAARATAERKTFGEAPEAAPTAVFTETECNMLEQAIPERTRQAPRNLDVYVRAIARLAVYLDSTSDTPRGTTVIRRGF